MQRRFTTRSLIAGTSLLALLAAIAAHSLLGALIVVSLLATAPVVAVAYLSIRHEQASWAIWLLWPILSAALVWLLGSYLSRFAG